MWMIVRWESTIIDYHAPFDQGFTLYDKRVGSFTSPADHNIEDAGDGAYGL